MAPLVEGVDRIALCDKGFREVGVATAVVSQAVGDQHGGASLAVRLPRPVEQRQLAYPEQPSAALRRRHIVVLSVFDGVHMLDPSICRIASTSTGLPPGSAATPTAERV